MATKGKAVGNFLKVGASAVTRPTRLFALAAGSVTALALPAIAIPALAATAIGVIAMSWADINDPEFIAKVLRARSDIDRSFSTRLTKLVRELEVRARNSQLYSEVKSDIREAIETINKINQTIGFLPAAEQGSISFVVDQIEKLSERLLVLVEKEQRAREFLATEDLGKSREEIELLTSQLNDASDSITKRQIEAAINQKQNLLSDYEQVRSRLERIDAYITNIRAALYSTYSNLARLQLRDEVMVVDDAEVLTESIRQIVNELDSFDEAQIEISSDTKPKKTKIAITN